VSIVNERQKAILFRASEWAGILNDAHCRQRLDEIRSLPDTRFAWSAHVRPVMRDLGGVTRRSTFNCEDAVG
jgi:hypothetical protein